MASSPIARPRGTTDKRRTITANSSRESSHHHDSAPPRLQPLICTGAEPIHPVHGLPKLQATEATPLIEVAFLPFWRVFCVYENMIPAPKQSQCKQLRYTTIPVLPCVHVMSIFLKKSTDVQALQGFLHYLWPMLVLLFCIKLLPFFLFWVSNPETQPNHWTTTERMASTQLAT